MYLNPRVIVKFPEERGRHIMSVRAIILIFTLASRPTRSRWQRNWLDKDQIQLHHVYVDRALMKCTLRNQNRIFRLFPLNDIMSHRSWKLWTKLKQFIPSFIIRCQKMSIFYIIIRSKFFSIFFACKQYVAWNRVVLNYFYLSDHFLVLFLSIFMLNLNFLKTLHC